MGAGAYSAGWGRFAVEVVVSIAEAARALGGSIKVKEFGDLETTSKRKETVQGRSGVRVL